jgi:hypothetical protein
MNTQQQGYNFNPVLYTTDLSLTVGTTAVTAYPQLQGYTYHFLRIFNTHASNTIWASRAGTAAVVGGKGSFSIGPGLYELWVAPGPVPLNSLSLISTGANTNVTIEVG